MGAAARVGHHGSRRPAVRLGPRLDPAERPPGERPRREVLRDWVAERDGATPTRSSRPAPTRDYRLAAAGADGDRLLTFPSALRNPASREQHGLLRGCFPAAARRRAHARPSSCCRSGTPMPGGHVGPVPAAGDERHDRAAPEPAVSRSADAARAAPRRLHRQRERRADGAGVPPGGARRAARDRLAGRRRVTSASASSARASARACRS